MTATLLALLLKATSLLAAAGLASLLLAKASAALRHALWTALFLALLILPLTALLPTWRILPHWPQQAPARGGRATEKAPAQSLPPPTVQPQFPTESLLPATPQPPLTYHPLPTAPALTPVPAPQPFPWLRLALLLWATGFLLAITRLARATLHLRHLTRRALPPTPDLAHDLADCQRLCPANATLRLSANSPMPLAHGLLHPTILLPATAAAWPADKRRTVLLHELTHIARGDLLAQTLAALAAAVWWFHPLVWFALRRLEIERERACDDAVLTTGLPADDYAQTLIDIASASLLRSPPMTVTALPMARQSTLESRVRRALNPRLRRAAVSRTLLAAMAVASLVAGLFFGTAGWAQDKPSPDAQKPAPSSQPAASALAQKVGNITIEVVAITTSQNSPTWSSDGTPKVADWTVPDAAALALNGDDRIVVFKLSGAGPDDHVTLSGGVDAPAFGAAPGMPGMAPGGTAPPLGQLRVTTESGEPTGYTAIPVKNSNGFGTLSIGVASGPWKTLLEAKPGDSTNAFSVGKSRLIEQSLPPEPLPAEAMAPGIVSNEQPRTIPVTTLRIAHTLQPEGEFRIVAVDPQGKEYPAQSISDAGAVGDLKEQLAAFPNLKPDQLTLVRLQSRPIQSAEIKNIPMTPGLHRDPHAGQLEKLDAQLNNARAAFERAKQEAALRPSMDTLNTRDALLKKLDELTRLKASLLADAPEKPSAGETPRPAFYAQPGEPSVFVDWQPKVLGRVRLTKEFDTIANLLKSIGLSDLHDDLLISLNRDEPDGKVTAWTKPAKEAAAYLVANGDSISVSQKDGTDKGGKSLRIIPADVEPKDGQPGEYSILGPVSRPGIYSMSGRKITVKIALATAGGLDGRASFKGATAQLVRRLPNDKETVIVIDLDALFAGREPDRYLQPNDLLNVSTPSAKDLDTIQSLETSLRDRQAALQELQKKGATSEAAALQAQIDQDQARLQAVLRATKPAQPVANPKADAIAKLEIELAQLRARAAVVGQQVGTGAYPSNWGDTRAKQEAFGRAQLEDLNQQIDVAAGTLENLKK